MRYLTKSRFILALDCLTKLYYTKNPEYADTNIDDPFLHALADGGFQVGELAKYYFCDDPIKDDITINIIDRMEAVVETQRRLKNENVIIAEASFTYQSLLARVDILKKTGSEINIYEVKAKSINGDDEKFINKKGVLDSKWIEKLYDIAFQKYVVEKSLKKKVKSHLILADKTKLSTVDGLNQKFKILKNHDGNTHIKTAPGLKSSDVGEQILKIINTDDIYEYIMKNPVPDYEIGFEEFINLCADIYTNDKQVFGLLKSTCRDCPFVNTLPEMKHLKSGFMECWKAATGYSDKLLQQDLVIDLWGGKAGPRSIVQELLDNEIYLLRDARESIVASKSEKIPDSGLSPHQRRMQQINRVKMKDITSYFDSVGFRDEMKRWKYPLHMIDFETSMTALPFHKGRHPYEGIAFQFSHHIMEKNGNVYHAGQYLSFEPGVFPNYTFARELKKQLQKDDGSIFRYHNHENTYLNFIYDQLETDPEPPEDKKELQTFISTIIKRKGNGITGPRNMIDLYEIILKYYYSPYAKGSNSIKDILPALIKESGYLNNKYGKADYGKGKKIKSLNFDEHIWIDPYFENDPYKTLPRLFNEYDPEILDELFGKFEGINDGGSAMTAYNYLQFSEIPQDQRIILKEGLLKYCELDTLAMVMIIEGLIDKAKYRMISEVINPSLNLKYK